MAAGACVADAAGECNGILVKESRRLQHPSPLRLFLNAHTSLHLEGQSVVFLMSRRPRWIPSLLFASTHKGEVSCSAPPAKSLRAFPHAYDRPGNHTTVRALRSIRALPISVPYRSHQLPVAQDCRIFGDECPAISSSSGSTGQISARPAAVRLQRPRNG